MARIYADLLFTIINKQATGSPFSHPSHFMYLVYVQLPLYSALDWYLRHHPLNPIDENAVYYTMAGRISAHLNNVKTAIIILTILFNLVWLLPKAYRCNYYEQPCKIFKYA